MGRGRRRAGTAHRLLLPGRARPSLTGDGHLSATVSTLNVTGHKDDAVAARFAAALAARFACTVTVGCGIHYDRPDPEAVHQVVRDSDDLLERLTTALAAHRGDDA
ncbi:MAG: hypothetical protein LUE17_06625 [Planctomycetaceae bacterium]|nr:hypothetical protein [Planctomycetaceae bacterium]